MAFETYCINEKIGDGCPATDILPIGIGSPFVQKNAAFVLMNDAGSDRLLRVQSLCLNECGVRTTTGLSNLLVRRITAMAGGESLTTCSMDSTAAAMPSQVAIVKNPGSVAASGAFKNTLVLNSVLDTSLAGIFASNGRATNQNMLDLQSADVQHIALAEGEGLCVDGNAVMAAPILLNITAWIKIGSETWIINYVAVPEAVRPVFAVFNGSGSGVTVNVVRLSIRPILDSSVFRFFTVERVSGSMGGDAVAPVMLDSGNTALSSGVLVRKNAAVFQAGEDACVGGAKQKGGDGTLRRIAAPFFGKTTELASGALAHHCNRSRLFTHTGAEVVLREGEGLALFQSLLAGGYGDYELELVFTAETTSSPGGSGEQSYIF